MRASRREPSGLESLRPASIVVGGLLLGLAVSLVSVSITRADATTPPPAAPASAPAVRKPASPAKVSPAPTKIAVAPAKTAMAPAKTAVAPAAAPAVAKAPVAPARAPVATQASPAPAKPNPALAKANPAPAKASPAPAKPNPALAKVGAPPAKTPVAASRMPGPPHRPGVTAAPASAAPSAVFPARPVGKSPLLAPVPALEERVTYQYNALGRRDPFVPMVGGTFVGDDVGGDAPPDVGGIKVVGIVWGADDKFALIEDARGSSGVLRAGDKVMNGFVETLRRDAVVVKLTVDGQTETVAIPLTRKGDQTNGNR